MARVIINNNVYTLIMGNLYSKHFVDYMNGDIINLDNLDLELRYKKVDELFGFVSRSFVVVLGDIQEEREDYKYNSEIADLRAKIASVDRTQRHFYEKGEIQKSIELMNSFMEKMLSLFNKIIDEENKVSMGR